MKTNKRYSLVGQDGNAYALMGYTQRAMRKCGCTKEYISSIMDKARSGDYNNLIMVLDEELTRLNAEE